jgi:hypothetical protein
MPGHASYSHSQTGHMPSRSSDATASGLTIVVQIRSSAFRKLALFSPECLRIPRPSLLHIETYTNSAVRRLGPSSPLPAVYDMPLVAGLVGRFVRHAVMSTITRCRVSTGATPYQAVDRHPLLSSRHTEPVFNSYVVKPIQTSGSWRLGVIQTGIQRPSLMSSTIGPVFASKSSSRTVDAPCLSRPALVQQELCSILSKSFSTEHI